MSEPRLKVNWYTEYTCARPECGASFAVLSLPTTPPLPGGYSTLRCPYCGWKWFRLDKEVASVPLPTQEAT